ncbi:MAG: cardiolipin synthase ClsB [Burkholderiaceae bacterium]|nr:cardiolipin synthase ClsB [Burkholderiaceae bacterium]
MNWVAGNDVKLLENGEGFFPRVFEAIADAKREVILETFILFEDKVGLQLAEALITAARNGAKVDVMVDGYGSPDLSVDFIKRLTDAGVRLRVFDPGKRIWGLRTNVLRRMHRKIVVVDGELAFVGGINYSHDHLADFGPQAKQDYAVELRGPIVAHIHRFVLHAIAVGGAGRHWLRRRVKPAPMPLLPVSGKVEAQFVMRDNRHHTDDIERHYRAAIRTARKQVIIANAYFFPGYRLIRELRRAARRGVDVRLILQGEPDMPIVKTAAGLLYHHLLHAGVKVYEYCERPLHGKVALVDGVWSTVGSSNLDPLSLSLNLEANVMLRDRDFAQTLGERLQHLMQHSCKQVDAADVEEPAAWRVVRSFFVFHAMRMFPVWARWLPAHTPRLQPAQVVEEAGGERAAQA